MPKIPLIAVVGPTASGKTALAVEIAKIKSGEIVSADSMQIYKGISIASAAPTKAEMQGIPHHMFEFLNPEQSYSVADYVNRANSVISDIYSRNKQPIIVGGTGLYVNSLTFGINFTEQPVNLELRQKLEQDYDLLGGQEMLNRLSVFDQVAAARLNIADKRRIVRAFEIFETTGITVTEQNRLSRTAPSVYDTTYIGITYKNRELLYERINKRVDVMLQNGLIEEAETTLNLPLGTAAAQAIGHKELHAYFKGEKDLQEAVEDLKRSTRRYAKRQLTWFRRNPDINWIYADETQNCVERALDIIKEREQKHEE
ncbi:MAG: tRNA (adenosine(37)-N6)-dimethylallyltransferase MiaA [Clostridia bacterium]|nr:tRNA (adenosine(37)-N6)-dimethylallyltransferase MiaA [Clostridia bacterium]